MSGLSSHYNHRQQRLHFNDLTCEMKDAEIKGQSLDEIIASVMSGSNKVVYKASILATSSDGVAIGADEELPVSDPSGGWSFQNAPFSGEKINWYFVGLDDNLRSFNDLEGFYCHITTRSSEMPYLNAYTHPNGQGDGDSWYATRYNMTGHQTGSPGEYVLYFAPENKSFEEVFPEEYADLSASGATFLNLYNDYPVALNGPGLVAMEHYRLVALSSDSGAESGIFMPLSSGGAQGNLLSGITDFAYEPAFGSATVFGKTVANGALLGTANDIFFVPADMRFGYHVNANGEYSGQIALLNSIIDELNAASQGDPYSSFTVITEVGQTRQVGKDDTKLGFNELFNLYAVALSENNNNPTDAYNAIHAAAVAATGSSSLAAGLADDVHPYNTAATSSNAGYDPTSNTQAEFEAFLKLFFDSRYDRKIPNGHVNHNDWVQARDSAQHSVSNYQLPYVDPDYYRLTIGQTEWDIQYILQGPGTPIKLVSGSVDGNKLVVSPSGRAQGDYDFTAHSANYKYKSLPAKPILPAASQNARLTLV